MTTGILERHELYNYRHRQVALENLRYSYAAFIGKQLLDGRAYVVLCGHDFTVCNFKNSLDERELAVRRALITLRNYEDAMVGEYVTFDALIATDRQLGIKVAQGAEYWIFGVDYFWLDRERGVVKCWKRIK